MEILNESQVLKNWSNFITESTGISEPSKVLWMSKMCQIQDTAEKSHALNEWNSGYAHLNPAMNIGGFGDMTFPTDGDNGFGTRNGSGDMPVSNVPIAVQVAAQTIALDLVPVVPMTSPFGILRYKDDVYEGGRIAGDVAFTAGKTDPLIVEVVKGQEKFEANSDGFVEDVELEGYTLKFVKKGFISGNPIVLVKVGADMNNTDVATPYSTGASDAAMTLAEAGEAEGLEFELVRAKEDHVTAFSGRDFFENSVKEGEHNPYDDQFGIEAYSREEGEATPLNLMSAKWTSADVKTKTYQVAYTLTWEQIEDAKTYGSDAIAEAEASMVNELSQSLNKMILSKMWQLGTKNANALKQQGIELNLNVDTLEGGETQQTYQKRIMDKILYASNLIAQRGRRGAGTFAICSAEIATAIQAVAGFAAAPMQNTINQSAGSMYPVGAVCGVTIYVDPNLAGNASTVIVGRKGKADEPGIVFCPYIMAAKQTVTPSATLGWKGGMKSRFAVVAVGQHPEVMYLTFNINGKRAIC